MLRMITYTQEFLSLAPTIAIAYEWTMLTSSPKATLEQYLLDTGILSDGQLDLAKRLQIRQQGPLLMILLELNFINLEQFRGLLDLDYAVGI